MNNLKINLPNRTALLAAWATTLKTANSFHFHYRQALCLCVLAILISFHFASTLFTRKNPLFSCFVSILDSFFTAPQLAWSFKFSLCCYTVSKCILVLPICWVITSPIVVALVFITSRTTAFIFFFPQKSNNAPEKRLSNWDQLLVENV